MSKRSNRWTVLADRAGEWVGDGAESLQSGLEDVGDRLARGGRSMHRAVRQGIGRVARAARRRAESLRATVGEHPGRALLAASAVGFALGVVVARRRR